MNDWRPIGWDDIPTRGEFEQQTLVLLYNGVTNSDRMRDAIRRKRKLILSITTGAWNTSPTDKFVNEHAWALQDLVMRGVIKRVSDKEYRLLKKLRFRKAS